MSILYSNIKFLSIAKSKCIRRAKEFDSVTAVNVTVGREDNVLKLFLRPGSNPGGFGFPVSGNIFDGN